MGRYEGLDAKLRQRIYERDRYRCRWCGTTNAMAFDIHHIRYRRGISDDVESNLILLCRTHHSFVHGAVADGNRNVIPKADAQRILFELIDRPGTTGLALMRKYR